MISNLKKINSNFTIFLNLFLFIFQINGYRSTFYKKVRQEVFFDRIEIYYTCLILGSKTEENI